LLYPLAVDIPGLEIHPGVNAGRILAQGGLVGAYRLKEEAPVRLSNSAQAQDDVGHQGGCVGRLFRCGFWHGASVCGKNLRRGREVGGLGRGKHSGQRVRQSLHQHIAQKGGHGPQLTDGEWYLLLHGHEHWFHDIQVQVIVLARQQVAAQAIDAGQAGQWPLGQPRQPAVISGWQVLFDLADGLADDVKVVQHPFGDAGGRRLGLCAITQLTIRLQQPGLQAFQILAGQVAARRGCAPAGDRAGPYVPVSGGQLVGSARNEVGENVVCSACLGHAPVAAAWRLCHSATPCAFGGALRLRGHDEGARDVLHDQ